MKITINNMQKSYPDLQIQSKEISRSPVSLSESSSFDQLFIQSDPRQIQESSFSDCLSRQISSEVSSATGNYEKIKAQVQNHTYQIDAQAIASRILLLGEGL